MRTKMDTEYYLSAFDTSKENLEKLVSEALKHGGDWCDLFFENTVNGNIALRDGIVSDGGFNVDYGAERKPVTSNVMRICHTVAYSSSA